MLIFTHTHPRRPIIITAFPDIPDSVVGLTISEINSLGVGAERRERALTSDEEVLLFEYQEQFQVVNAYLVAGKACGRLTSSAAVYDGTNEECRRSIDRSRNHRGGNTSINRRAHFQPATSCAHGAGRKMSRTAAEKQFSEADLVRQTEGVICRKDKGVVDEIPGAYKDIDIVMANQSDLVDPVHTLKQVVCVKG